MQLFLMSCRSPETRNNYELLFQKYIDFVGDTDLFFQNNPRLIEAKIIEFILYLRDKGKTYSAIRNYLTAIKSFYKINDVVLNDRKIVKFLPEQLRVGNDRAYTHEEISKLLQIADERMRAVILLMASSGIRIGAIPLLRLGNLQDSKLTVYKGSREEYSTFITPECKEAIDSYLDMRSRYGEKLDEKSYLIREQFDIRDQFAISKSKQVTRHLIGWRLISMGERCGIRKRSHDKKIRQGIMVAHGFRKFFTTQCVNSNMKAEIREMLLGHKIGLTRVYYKPTQEDMFKEYLVAENNLTINEENRLKDENQTLQHKIGKLELILDRIDVLEKEIGINQK